MILYPPVLALLSGSFLILFILLYANWYGLKILRHWDLRSGSELQLDLERRTYLISTIMAYGMVFQLFSLFLFIFTTDHLSVHFTGAMCAAGTLNVNDWGYPTLLLKIVNFLAAGVWLIVNAVDNSAWDYPLIRKKYALLLPVTASICLETIVQTYYFLELKPEIITSCCGTLFSSASGEEISILDLPWETVAALFFSLLTLTLASGLYFHFRQKGGFIFGILNALLFPLSAVALIAYISPYIYELPTHHCPFCILHTEYRFVGYPLYLAFLAGGVSGLGVGATAPFSGIASLENALPRIRRELTLVSLLCWTAGLGLTLWAVLTSNLRMW